MAIVLHHSKSQGTTRNVLIGIANHHSDRGAWPSLATLRKYAGGVTERTVQRSLRELEALGELSVEIQGGGDGRRTRGGRETNRYFVLLRCPDWCDRSMNHRDVRQIDVPFPDP
ncbi:helix-turn-helix domain-containing protein [Pimelobacter simplex]|uniref:Helix-turn-helix domain-containing protein n=1 Tax=Nocardioides simplex TaxID=2045 RepID=A0A7J5DVP1_NOCSI|nr:helix-turn-helix domain-containing protein [Pimelobacter simplex]KAB2809289.1 helix-turn-helix domain-containing protein [Pimelobacter simplex]